MLREFKKEEEEEEEKNKEKMDEHEMDGTCDALPLPCIQFRFLSHEAKSFHLSYSDCAIEVSG